MEIETAARRLLLADETVNSYVAGKVFKGTLLQTPEGTGGYAIVVRRGAGWWSPDPVNTSEYPLLVVECWADPDRENGVKKRENGADKAWALFRAVDGLLHAQRDQWWGAGGANPGLRIISCARDSEPVAVGGPDARLGDRAAAFGDLWMVPAVYDVHTVH